MPTLPQREFRVRLRQVISAAMISIAFGTAARSQQFNGADPDVLSGACAFDEKRPSDALAFFLNAQRRGVAYPDLQVFIARAIDAQYKEGDRSAANITVARNAIAAYEPLLENKEFSDEALWAITSHHFEVNADRIESIAASGSTPKRLRASIYAELASKANSCADEVVEAPANRRKVRVAGVLKTTYKMPALRSDFEKAKSCVTQGLEHIENAIRIEPANSRLWLTKRFLLQSGSQLSEMAGESADKLSKAKASDAANAEYQRLNSAEEALRDKNFADKLEQIRKSSAAGPEDLQRFVESGLLREEPKDHIRQLMARTTTLVAPPGPSDDSEEKAEAARRAKLPWKLFAPAGSRFSILAPSPMEVASSGSQVTIYRVTSENVDYQITTMNTPVQTELLDSRAVLATAVWGSVGSLCNWATMANYVCEVKFARDLTLNDKPGREYSVAQAKCSSKIPGVVRAYSTGAGLVVIQAIRADGNDPNVRKMFDSLVLK